MDETAEIKPPSWYRPAAIVAVLWELMGVASYLYHVSLSPEAIAALPPGQATLMTITPAWVNGAFAIATFGGLLGALGLVLRRRWARALLIVSLIAVIIQFGWTFAVGKAHELIGPSAAGFPAFIILVAILLVWFAGVATRRGWLR
jgi:hypothetical protein